MRFGAIFGIFSFIKQTTLKIIRRFNQIVVTTISYCYQSADLFLQRSFQRIADLFQKYWTNEKVTYRKWLTKIIYFLVFSVVSIGIVMFIFAKGSFIVPVGQSAVVIRVGQYRRQVEAGFHLRIPFIEQYLIVNSGNLMEETFGLLPTPPKANDVEITQQERLTQEQYETELARSEKDPGTVFSARGNVMDVLNQKLRLTNSYIRQEYAPAPGMTLHQKKLLAKKHTLDKIQPNNVVIKPPIDTQSTFITGDLNIIHLTWSLQYNISNPKDYLFNSQDVEQNIRDIARSIMSEVIGESLFDKILSTDRDRIEHKVQDKIQKRFNKYRLGLKVNQVIILDALPVENVIFAFNEVNKASQDMEKIVYQAEMEYQNSIPEASGIAKKMVATAKADAIKTINQAEGNAAQFDQVLAEYQKAPQITKDRLYIEAIESILQKTPHLIIDPALSGVFPVVMGQTKANAQQSLTSSSSLMNSLLPEGMQGNSGFPANLALTPDPLMALTNTTLATTTPPATPAPVAAPVPTAAAPAPAPAAAATPAASIAPAPAPALTPARTVP